jgi:UDP-glucuronate 4-epimerase
MAFFIFTKSILENKPINVYNYGKMQRDFTYISDIVEGIIKVTDHPPAGNPGWDSSNLDPSRSIAPYRVYNIGNSKPVELMDFIRAIEEKLGMEAQKNLLPIQPGDITSTYADVSDLMRDFNYKPDTSVQDGIGKFVDWYKDFYDID